MTTDQIKALKSAEPFQPFKIFTSRGETFDVRSKNHILVAGTTILIGVDIDPADNVPDRVVHRGIEFIERVETIPQAA